jgi:hypothetical protein
MTEPTPTRRGTRASSRSDCHRVGCIRRPEDERGYCSHWCRLLNNEFSRLGALYEAAGDLGQDRTAWLLLVDISDT